MAAVVVQGHRACGDLAPHNTVKAVRKAAELGVQSVEFDVQRTSDGHLVVTHGCEVYQDIGTATLADLQAVDLGMGERTPLLADFVDACLECNLAMNVEIKPREGPKTVREVIDLLRGKKALPFCTISSFDRAILKVVMEVAPEVPVGALYHDYEFLGTDPAGNPAGLKYFDLCEDFVSWFAHRGVHGDSVNLSAEPLLKDPSLIHKARAAGKRVLAWFPSIANPGYEDSEDMYKRLIDIGVDSICSNRPDLLKEVVASMAGSPARFSAMETCQAAASESEWHTSEMHQFSKRARIA